MKKIKVKVKPFDEDERIILTPKGLAVVALSEAKFIDNTSDSRIDIFWNRFEELMISKGYVEDKNNE